MTLKHLGTNPKWFQENMGRGGAIPLEMRLVQNQPNSSDKNQDQAPADSQWEQELKEFDQQIAQEAREQWSGFDYRCIEAYKRGDRIGLPFEGGTMFQPINEQLLDMALQSAKGSDESSIVGCFYMFAGWCHHTTKEQFVWDWVSYHEQNHGTGYGKTYRDHFNLVAYIRKHQEEYPDLASKLNKLSEIAVDVNSFGNASLALVYPAYYYAAIVGEEPYEFVRYLTGFTHAHADVMKAVTLLCNFIENPRLIVEYRIPNEYELKRLYCSSSNVTAYNTLLTAIFIAGAESEMEVIRRGVYTSGDTDSTLATAMLLWSLKSKGGQ
jgi:hypothetical protein